MTRLLTAGLGLVLALAFALGQSILLPQPVLACSCAGPPPTLAEVVAQEPGVTILVGTVGPPQPEMTPVTVNAWFHGPFPSDGVWVSGGRNMMSSCDYPLEVGRQYVLVLYGGSGLPYSTSLCTPNAALDTPEGAQLLAEAQAVFGLGEEPPADEQPPGSPAPDTDPLLDAQNWVWLIGGSLAALAVLLGAVLLASRRRPLS